MAPFSAAAARVLSACVHKDLRAAAKCVRGDAGLADTLEMLGLDLWVADCVGVEAWPPASRPRLAARVREARVLSSAEDEVLRACIEALADASIPSLVLKGAALAHTVYPQPWTRPHGDIDLLVPLDRFELACATIETLGFRPDLQVRDRAVTAQQQLRRDGPVPAAVDLHARLVNPLLFNAVPEFADLNSRSVELTAISRRARTLDRVDALLHALLHRVAHHYRSDRPLWLLDIHLLASVLDAVGWAAADRRAREWRIGRIAADGLAAARDLFGTEVPVVDAWSAIEDEPSGVLVHRRVTEWRLQWLSFQQASLAAKLALLRAHALPSADYMLAKYGTEHRWRLPELYARRAFNALWRWVSA